MLRDHERRTPVICLVDIETTGLTPPEAAVCEIGYQEIEACGKDAAGGPTDWQIGIGDAVFVNPGHPIPAITSAIHHIVDEDVLEARPWEVVAPEIFAECPATIAYAAHNAKFERLFITEKDTGKPWICTYKCALRQWPDAPSHSNQALRYYLKPEGLDREFANTAHRALPDAYVSAFTLIELLKHQSVETLIAWSNEPALLIRCHFGKHRGQLYSVIDSGMLRWILGKEFDEDVHHTCRYHLEKRAKREAAVA